MFLKTAFEFKINKKKIFFNSMKEHQKSLIGNKVNELNDSPIPVDIPKMSSGMSIATQPMPQYPPTGNNIGSLITINRNVVNGSYNSSYICIINQF